MPHYQINSVPSGYPISSNYEVKIKHFGKPCLKETIMRPVDQFFSQRHNLRNGDINTSPLMFDDPAAASHFQSVSERPDFSSKVSVDDIHSTVISKDCQSLSQVAQLKHILKPVKPDLDEEPVSVSSEPSSAPASNTGE